MAGPSQPNRPLSTQRSYICTDHRIKQVMVDALNHVVTNLSHAQHGQTVFFLGVTWRVNQFFKPFLG